MRIVTFLAPVLFVAMVTSVAAQTTPSMCQATGSPEYFDDLSGMWSPCAVAPGKLVAEATYLQNASAVGGTALAAYPLVTLRTGIARDVSFIFNSPSQIAESGLGGAGLYPRTHLGYGLSYSAVQNAGIAIAVVGEILPPVGRFAANSAQSRYLLGATSDYAPGRKLDVGFFGTATSSGTSGLERVFPSGAFKAAYNVTPVMQFTTDLGMRAMAKRAVAQSFGDLGIKETFRKTFALQLGAGTTFNPVTNNKAHYLASGLSYAL
ncbi:MAG: hypothetical protein JO092_03325 [Candidatus Eremiobacteraeota bacterium]|nr:hypothetical protein [Candidatus Eremiobacteraeota bacterium]